MTEWEISYKQTRHDRFETDVNDRVEGILSRTPGVTITSSGGGTAFGAWASEDGLDCDQYFVVDVVGHPLTVLAPAMADIRALVGDVEIEQVEAEV